MDFRMYEPIFGSWYITEELGAGGEGRLFRICRTDSLGHKYYSALKTISVPASKAETASLMAGGMQLEEVAAYYDSVLENATHEFEILAKLKGNSNIASYEDHEVFRHEDGIGWDILIRLEELTPLVDYSIDHPLSEDEVTRMGIDICRGLSLCKKYGIVHRDIKPDNIFISPSGSYKLGDFGIARIIEKTTSGLSRKGTYEYMAPEVYWGRDYGSTVDLYSLGMVMYRYLNDGRMPFMPQSPAAIIADDREEAFVKRVNGHVVPEPRCGSDELKRIVLKACAHDVADRYQDAEEMLTDLEALVNAGIYVRAGGDRVEPQNIAKAALKGSGRRKASIGIVAALCLLIVCAVWAAVPKEVTDIELGPVEGAAEIYIGDDLALSYAVVPDRFKDEPILFKSSDENVFSVDDSGVLHALTLGEATLTLTAKEYSEEVAISVVPKVTSISGIDETVSLTTGDVLTLEPVTAPEEFADEPVYFSTADDTIATVSEDGQLTAIAAGETTLNVTSGGCTFNAVISVEDPVVYTSGFTNKSSKKKSGSKSDTGYFKSSDDEHF